MIFEFGADLMFGACVRPWTRHQPKGACEAAFVALPLGMFCLAQQTYPKSFYKLMLCYMYVYFVYIIYSYLVQSYQCSIYGTKLDSNIRLSASNGNQCDCVNSAACMPGGTDPTMLACCMHLLFCVTIGCLFPQLLSLYNTTRRLRRE